MPRFFKREPAPEYVEGKNDYTKSELEAMADDVLLKDRDRELCRKCLKKGLELPYGEETGKKKDEPQFDKDKKPILGEDGRQRCVVYPELICEAGHKWYRAEGKRRDISGPNPILFENHLQDRRRREIYTTLGTPEPDIVSGLYNRTHPQGRKVNSDAQRKKNGASYYR